jgi:cobalt-zinc-cadmium efflux system outer membrane protein
MLVGSLAGCRSYEPEPLDLAAHRGEVSARLDDLEPARDFLARLAAAGVPVPDRFDPADGLTLAEGEVLALFQNPDLRLARWEAGIAAATARNAGRWQDPVFGFDAEEVLSGGEPFIYGLTLQMTIPVSGRLEVERDRADAAFSADLADLVAAEWRTRAAVRRAWVTWTMRQQSVRLLEELADRTDRISAIADRLESAGGIGRTESRLIRVERDMRRTQAIEMAAEADAARLDILALMGLSPDAAVRLLPAADAPPAPVTDDPLARLIAANPSLAALRARYAVAEETLRLEIRRQYPDITIGGGYGSEGDDRLLFGFSIPIPIFDRNVPAIEDATARRAVARATAENAFERLAVDLARATMRREAARRQQAAFASAIVPALDEQTAELERLADLGELDVLLLLDAEDRRFDAGIRVLQLRHEHAEAEIELAALLGPDTPAAPAPTSTPAVAPIPATASAPAPGGTR